MSARLDLAAENLAQLLREEDPQSWLNFIASSEALLSEACAGVEEEEANKAWFLMKVAKVRRGYLTAMLLLRDKKYYEAWCELEQVEIGSQTLRQNPLYSLDAFEVERLAQQVADWQSLYPYSIFFSPEYLIRREECSICRESVDPWSSCRHLPLKVYHGRECHRIVTDFEVLSISAVRDPVQKYSVARVLSKDEFGNEIDQFDYSPVQYVIDGLTSLFGAWRPIRTVKMHPPSLFASFPTSSPCPCGGDRSYGDCCMNKDAVAIPHVDILFEQPPPSNLPRYVPPPTLRRLADAEGASDE